MKTEAQRSFRQGFFLTEPELRRILDALTQQTKKAHALSSPTVSFEIKFINGAISTTSSVDDVVSLENFGSAAVSRLTINVNDSVADPRTEVILQFSNAERDEDSWAGVHYTIKGDDRDWVFVTSSQLEERINKIKVLAFGQIFSRKYLPFLFALLYAPLLLGLLPTMHNEPDIAGKLDKLWQTGQIKDPIEAIIYVERARRSQDLLAQWVPMTIASLLVLPVFVFSSFSFLFPAYNFYWGDYINFYSKRKSVRVFVLIIVLVSLLVGVVSGMIVNKFRLGM